jgi:hypothetical protein
MTHAPPTIRDRLEVVVAGALAARPPAVQRKLVLFIRALDVMARVRYGRPLARLDPVRRTALVEAVGRSPLQPLRLGVWGLRTLIQMGYYTQPDVQADLGYRATAAGWDARR